MKEKKRMSRIMIVEGDQHVRELLVTYFAESPQEKHNVSSFSSAEKALEVIRQNPNAIDIVISSNHLPGMDGVSFVEAVKNIRADIPTVLISGYQISPCRTKADAFYLKPFDIEELGCAVRRLLPPVTA